MHSCARAKKPARANTRTHTHTYPTLTSYALILWQVAASTSGRWSFQGIDTSIAPGLDTPSMTDAYEALGLGPFGGPGELQALPAT